jgi:hypothetical protein
LALNNCVHFARDAWNLCVDSDQTIDSVTNLPDVMELDIKRFTEWGTGSGQSIAGNATHGYYDGTGYVVCTHD